MGTDEERVCSSSKYPLKNCLLLLPACVWCGVLVFPLTSSLKQTEAARGPPALPAGEGFLERMEGKGNSSFLSSDDFILVERLLQCVMKPG